MSSTTDATEYLYRKVNITKMTIIQEYNYEMKENSYIIVVTKSIVFVAIRFFIQIHRWEGTIIRTILIFAASKFLSKRFIRVLSYNEFKF